MREKVKIVSWKNRAWVYEECTNCSNIAMPSCLRLQSPKSSTRTWCWCSRWSKKNTTEFKVVIGSCHVPCAMCKHSCILEYGRWLCNCIRQSFEKIISHWSSENPMVCCKVPQVRVTIVVVQVEDIYSLYDVFIRVYMCRTRTLNRESTSRYLSSEKIWYMIFMLASSSSTLYSYFAASRRNIRSIVLEFAVAASHRSFCNCPINPRYDVIDFKVESSRRIADVGQSSYRNFGF